MRLKVPKGLRLLHLPSRKRRMQQLRFRTVEMRLLKRPLLRPTRMSHRPYRRTDTCAHRRADGGAYCRANAGAYRRTNAGTYRYAEAGTNSHAEQR